MCMLIHKLAPILLSYFNRSAAIICSTMSFVVEVTYRLVFRFLPYLPLLLLRSRGTMPLI